MTIIIGQVPKLLGLEKVLGYFFEQLWHIIGELGQTSLMTLTLSMIVVVIIYVPEERFLKVPGVLLLFLIGLAPAYHLEWESAMVQSGGTMEACPKRLEEMNMALKKRCEGR